LLYLILGLCAMSARVCPRPLQQVLSRCVYNVTTDGTPVFTQLGNMVGGVAALLTALLDLIRPA
jgi:hypothetical protein